MTCASRPIGVTSHTTPLSIRRGVGGEASVNSVCRRRSVGSKRAWKSSVKSVSSVREKTPQRFFCVSSHNVGAFYFSQIYTEEQNSQRRTETLSQPISQNLIAIFGSNALWTLYAGGVLWARNCALKTSVTSVFSVREKNIQHERKECLLWEKIRPTPHVNSIIGVNSYFTYYLQQLCKIEKNPYNPPSWPPSQHSYSIVYNRGYNSQ